MNRRKAISSFICGLFFPLWLFNFFFGVAAVVFGVWALRDIRSSPEEYGGTVFAIIGVVLGLIPLFGGALYATVLILRYIYM